MVAKLKGNFLPKDYQLYLFRKMHNLMEKKLTVKEYIVEFYKANIRAGYVEDLPKRVARYINGLRFEIQDEMNFLWPCSVEEAYYFSLKAKEKLKRKCQVKSWGTF